MQEYAQNNVPSHSRSLDAVMCFIGLIFLRIQHFEQYVNIFAASARDLKVMTYRKESNYSVKFQSVCLKFPVGCSCGNNFDSARFVNGRSFSSRLYIKLDLFSTNNRYKLRRRIAFLFRNQIYRMGSLCVTSFAHTVNQINTK